MLNKMLIMMVFLSVSCSTFFNKGNNGDDNILKSENYVLKKRIKMIERRNRVIENENIYFKKDIKDRDARIGNLKSEIESQKAKNEKDIELWKEKYKIINNKNEILSKESSEKITELIELNKKSELNFSKRIEILNKDILAKEKNFADKLENIKKQAAEKEFHLSKDIEKLRQDIDEKNNIIVLLDVKAKEFQNMLDQLKRDNKLKKQSVKKLNNKIINLNMALEKMKAVIKEKDLLIKSIKKRKKI